MTAKFRAGRLWIVHLSPFILIAGGLTIVPYAWPYLARWSWAFPIAVGFVVFGSIHVVTFTAGKRIVYRKFLCFFPLHKLEMDGRSCDSCDMHAGQCRECDGEGELAAENAPAPRRDQ